MTFSYAGQSNRMDTITLNVAPINPQTYVLKYLGTRVLVLRYVHIHATDVSVMAGTDVSVLSDICIRDPWGKITDASVILVFRIRLS
jgi:hypothetical protein